MGKPRQSKTAASEGASEIWLADLSPLRTTVYNEENIFPFSFFDVSKVVVFAGYFSDL